MVAMAVEAWRTEADSCKDNFGKAVDDVEMGEVDCTAYDLADHWEAEPLAEPGAGLGVEDSWPKPEGGGLLGPP